MTNNIIANYHSAFKDADIRGVYPTEIDEEVAYLVARAFVDEFKLKKVLVARDMRLSSGSLYKAFCTGVVDAGAQVIDIGLVSTPILYFASGSKNLPGVVITASHSPKQYNGLKLVLPGAVPLTEKHGLGAIRKRIDKGVFALAKKPGKITKQDFQASYLKFVTKGLKTKAWPKLKLAVDCGNGMSAVVIPLLKSKLPIKFTTLYDKLDGNFPNRGSDPTLKKNQKGITKLLKTNSHDFGISFDGDADRIAFFDETGKYINSAVIGALVAKRMLKQHPKAKFIYTNLTSRVYEETIKEFGGKAVPARVGHAFIKETMRQMDVLFACEHSGHFYFKEYFYTDSVTLTLLYVLEAYLEAKSTGVSFSSMIKPYLKYEQTEDVIVEVKDKHKALEQVHEYLLKKSPLTIKKFDGYAVDFGEVWGSVKISVTEHALKMMFESRQKKLAQALQDDIVHFVKGIADD
ncbi:MAG: phosphomannomutase/phosphoglucomutase [Candidatus Paceibacterota bacterium]